MIRRSSIAIGIVALVVAAPIAGPLEQWPQFRGPSAGVAPDDLALPERWSTTESVVWALDVPGVGWSSPVVWGDHIFVTSVVDSGQSEVPRPGLYMGGERPAPTAPHRWMVHDVDFATGKIRWSREIRNGLPGPKHLKNSYASETPVTDGERVYVYRGFFACHDARTGREIYGRQRIAVDASGFTSSPWAYNGRVFVMSEDGDTYVIAAGPQFKVLGKNSLGEMTLATPAISRGSLIIRTASKLYRFMKSRL